MRITKLHAIDTSRKNGVNAWSAKTINIGVLCLLSGVLLFCTVILFPIGFFLAAIGASFVILGTTGELVTNFPDWLVRRKIQPL